MGLRIRNPFKEKAAQTTTDVKNVFLDVIERVTKIKNALSNLDIEKDFYTIKVEGKEDNAWIKKLRKMDGQNPETPLFSTYDIGLEECTIHIWDQVPDKKKGMRYDIEMANIPENLIVHSENNEKTLLAHPGENKGHKQDILKTIDYCIELTAAEQNRVNSAPESTSKSYLKNSTYINGIGKPKAETLVQVANQINLEGTKPAPVIINR